MTAGERIDALLRELAAQGPTKEDLDAITEGGPTDEELDAIARSGPSAEELAAMFPSKDEMDASIAALIEELG